MGESVDDSDYSDETIEAQGRGVDTSKSLGFASKEIEDKYIEDQNKMLASKFVKSNLPDVLDRQDFAREQDFIDANPTFTGIDTPFTTRSADLDPQLGAGDIFGLRDSVRKQLSFRR